MDCSSNEECNSVNYNPVKKICELNRFADEAAIKKIGSSQGWVFYKKEIGVSCIVQRVSIENNLKHV